MRNWLSASGWMQMSDSEVRSMKQPGFETVYEMYYDRVYKYAYTILLNKEDAEDVTAETFLAAYRNYSRYDAEKASIATWLTRIAHNRAVNLRRSAAYAKRAEWTEALDRTSDGTDFTGRVENDDTVLRLYARLRPEERELLNMRYVMELKDREIGGLLGLSDKTVNKRFQRLLVKCRGILKSNGE